jgi:Peptidase_C39 like family
MTRTAKRSVNWIVVLTLAIVGAEPLHAANYKSVRIDGVPFVRQRADFCGEACAEMALRKLGKRMDQDFVFNQSQLDPVEGRGCYTKELARALTAIGFRVGPTWQKVAAKSADRELEACFATMYADLAAGIPSIVCMHFDDRPGTTEHFRLVLGYDAKTEEVIYHDPALSDGAYRRMAKAEFIKLWPLKYADDTWTVVRLRLEPGQLIDDASSTAVDPRFAGSRFSAADYAQHVLALKKRLPEPGGFTIVIQPPFMVIGDEAAEKVRSRAENTVKWAVDRVKQSYFTRDPEQILDIWLFKNKASYEKNAKEIFDDKPTTPYGYFSSVHHALVMNISTGGGTLVHEIVHPFMAANFPACPSWFNEGLASLYEQSGEENGRIHGYVNWRLHALQTAIKKKRVPSFEALCSTTTEQFYHEDPGTNYSQARYLCYYLQEKGLLEKYYRDFRAHASKDPTGYKTLQAVLGETDMDAFKTRWEAFVLKLEFD